MDGISDSNSFLVLKNFKHDGLEGVAGVERLHERDRDE